MRNSLDEFVNLAVRLESHPFNTERACLESSNEDVEMLEIAFFRMAKRRRYAEMVIPPTLGEDWRWFVILPQSFVLFVAHQFDLCSIGNTRLCRTACVIAA